MKFKEQKEKSLAFIKKHKILCLSFLILITMFSITRLPFFLYYPVVNLDSDSPYYYINVDQVDKGMWPLFIIRTPGYFLFLKVVFLFFNKNISLIAVQNIFTLLTSLFFIYIIYKVYAKRFKLMPLWASVGIGAFISSSIHLKLDTTYMTESIYINFLILFAAVFILSIHAKTRITWILCSICMAFVILIRPSALFLILIFVIIAFFQLINSYKKAAVFLFAIPFIGILFLMAFYNYVTIGSFSITTFSENALISFTATFLEKNQAYPPEVNKAIEKCQNRVTPAQRHVMENSWDCTKLFRVLTKHYNRSRKLIFDTLAAYEKEDSFSLYMKWRPILKKVAVDSILSRPKIFIKYIYSNLMINFFHRNQDIDFYKELKDIYLKSLNYKRHHTRTILDKEVMRTKAHSLRVYSNREYALSISEELPRSFLKEYWDREVFSQIKIKKVKRKVARIEPTFLLGVHQVYSSIHGFFFRNNLWVFIFLFVLIFSFIKLLRSRFFHKDAFILFIMTLSALLHGMVVSMGSVPHIRLIFPMQFVYYLSLFLLPTIIDFKQVGRFMKKLKGAGAS